MEDKDFKGVSSMIQKGVFFPDKDYRIPNGQLDIYDFEAFYNLHNSITSSYKLDKTIQYLSVFDKFTKQSIYNRFAEAIIKDKMVLTSITEDELKTLIGMAHVQNTDWKLVNHLGVDAPRIEVNNGHNDLDSSLLNFHLNKRLVGSFDWMTNKDTNEKDLILNAKVDWSNILGKEGFYWKEQVDDLLNKKLDITKVFNIEGNLNEEIINYIFSKDGTDYKKHVDNHDIHITSEERENWDSKYLKPLGGIPINDLCEEVKINLKKYNKHIEDNIIHITQRERIYWDSKFSFPEGGLGLGHLSENIKNIINNKLDKNFILNEDDKIKDEFISKTGIENLQSSIDEHIKKFEEHRANKYDELHVSSEEKNIWNSKYSRPVTGIPINHLDDSVKKILTGSLLKETIINPKTGKIYMNLLDLENIIKKDPTSESGKFEIPQYILKHVDNMEIHVNELEKEGWNNKYDGSDLSAKKLQLGYIPDKHLSDSAQKIISNGVAKSDLFDEHSKIRNELIDGFTKINDFNNHINNNNIHLSKEILEKINKSIIKSDIFVRDEHGKEIFNPDKMDMTYNKTLIEHVQNKDIHVTKEEKDEWNSKYSMPVGGIPKDDLSQSLQHIINSKLQAMDGIICVKDYEELLTVETVNLNDQSIGIVKKSEGLMSEVYLFNPLVGKWERTANRITVSSSSPKTAIKGDINFRKF